MNSGFGDTYKPERADWRDLFYFMVTLFFAELKVQKEHLHLHWCHTFSAPEHYHICKLLVIANNMLLD